MSLLPTATIRVQKAGIVADDGNAKFFVLPISNISKPKQIGLVASCVIEFSTTSESTAATAVFEVNNLHPDVVRQMALLGYVKIEAGYIGHATRPPQLIFFGRLDAPEWSLDSGQIKWKFTATALPNEIWAIKPRAAQPIGANGKPQGITIGEAIRIIADRIGIGRANVVLPKIFDGDLSTTPIQGGLTPKVSESFKNAVTLATWTTTRTAIEELQDLLKQVTVAMQQTFSVIRNYSILPDVNNPFRVVIDDISLYTGEAMNIDLDSLQIITAGPVYTTATTPPSDTSTQAADDAGTAEPANQVVQVQEFQIVSVFDPKVSMGLLTHGTSKKYGFDVKVKAQKGKHSLNGSPLRWRTEYSGAVEAPPVVVARGS